MRILLIGGNGFIGSPLAKELRDSGHSVAIFHRSADKSPDKNVVRIQGDRNRLWVKTENDPLVSSPEPAMTETFRAIVHLESAVLADQTIGGFVLRYGSFYGPGTSLGQGGSLLEDIRQRRVPIVGKGTGYWSFVHIDDAASATLAAVEAACPGLYNVCDDEPAPVSQ